MAAKQVFQEMFDNAVHIGHRTQRWNPRMKPFLYGENSGVHIINLEKTVEKLEVALTFLAKIAAEGRSVLFVSTKPQSITLLEESARDAGMPYVTTRWIPGLLTNFSTIKTRIKYLRDLKERESAGDFEKYTKKEASTLRKTIDKLEVSLGGVQEITQVPDAVFVLDVVRDSIAVMEAKKIGIPVIGIVDSNADPSKIDYPIPGNDDALKSLIYLVGKISETIKASRKAKK